MRVHGPRASGLAYLSECRANPIHCQCLPTTRSPSDIGPCSDAPQVIEHTAPIQYQLRAQFGQNTQKRCPWRSRVKQLARKGRSRRTNHASRLAEGHPVRCRPSPERQALPGRPIRGGIRRWWLSRATTPGQRRANCRPAGTAATAQAGVYCSSSYSSSPGYCGGLSPTSWVTRGYSPPSDSPSVLMTLMRCHQSSPKSNQ